MRRAVSYLPLALLFLACAVPSNGQNTETTTAEADTSLRTADDFTGELFFFEVRSIGSFVLNCSIGGKISWKKNGTDISQLPELDGHLVTKPLGGVENAALALNGRATENDFGNYTCANDNGQQMSWRVKARPHAKLPSDSNVVEGQKLKLTCKIIGRPYPRVEWTYSNVSEEVGNDSLTVQAALGDRVQLSTSEQGVEDGELVIDSAVRSDAGWYKCSPVDKEANGTSSITTLRVKDMYAALWPFLGICAEVFILCAIILVYEKRRTKPELDDSDTDNHDQKKS